MASPNVTALEVEDVSVVYPHQNQSAIEAISFKVATGTTASLLGPNGAGKSTLIKAILGIEPYTGNITVLNQPIQQASHLIGYVPQRYQINPAIPITVTEFLALALSRCNHPNHQVETLINQVMTWLHIGRLGSRTLDHLSGGQLQRVLIARAMVHQPKLLILDEPEAGIDVGAEQSLFNLLKDIRDNQQITILMASHELDVVYGFSDQVICINQRMVCTGKPQKVLTKETFQQLYGGDIRLYGHTHL